MKNPWDFDNTNSTENNNKNEDTVKNKKIDDKSPIKNILEFIQKNKIKKSSKTNKNNLIILIASVTLCIWLLQGIYKVNSDENAIVFYFGKYHETTIPGLHFYIPSPIGSVKKASVARINKEDFGFSSSSNNNEKLDEESLMLTGDENIADIDFEVQWKIQNVKDYLLNIKDQQNTIRSATESVMREIIANRNIDDVLANKKFEIETEAKELLQSILNSYNTGIEIITVQLLRADPPKEVINAFRDVQTAKADKERKINDAKSYNNDIIPKARGEAEAIIQKAEGYKKSIVTKAEGETERFNKIYQEYRLNKEITRQRIYIETMEDVIKENDKIIMDSRINNNFINFLNK